jgi:hypothetical protein
VAKLLLSLPHHAVAHDQAVAVLRVALEAEQADRLSFGERDRLAEVEQGFGLLHMLQENALEAFDVSGARRVTTTLRCAEPAQVPIADRGVSEMRRELVLGEALLARDRCRADVEDQLDAGVFERADEATVPPS